MDLMWTDVDDEVVDIIELLVMRYKRGVFAKEICDCSWSAFRGLAYSRIKGLPADCVKSKTKSKGCRTLVS